MCKITAGSTLNIYKVHLDIFIYIPKPILCTKFSYHLSGE